jgi:hypothetical protein
MSTKCCETCRCSSGWRRMPDGRISRGEMGRCDWTPPPIVYPICVTSGYFWTVAFRAENRATWAHNGNDCPCYEEKP